MKSPQISPLRIVFTFWKKGALVAAAISVLGASFSPAAVIGYWRFEDGGFLADSGANGLTLSASATAPTQTAIPESGNGSKFFNPIPETQTSNGNFAGSMGSGTYFSRADSAIFDVSTGGAFTIEALANTTTIAGSNKIIASQWSTNRGWSFGLNGATLQLQVSPSPGSSAVTISSGINLLANVDYYLAASFDLSDQTSGVKFYYQDLTNEGVLQTVTMGHSLLTLNNSSAGFGIGAINVSTASPSGFWNGSIDEVRLSNTALPQSDLLAVPEPATVALIGLGLALGIFRRRKKAAQ